MGLIKHRAMRRNPANGLGKLCFWGFCVLTAMHAAEWHIETVPDITGGKFSSLKLDRYGNAHVVHMEGFDNMLRYSFWDRNLNKWFSTDLARASGFCSLALDSKQRPHISYPAGSGVTHMYWDGERWQKQFANVHARGINYYTSIALDPKDNPIISFYEEYGPGDVWGRLRVVVWNGSYWDLKTVDPDHGSGKFNSVAINSRGYPEIAYGTVEYQYRSLRYARWNGERWKAEILEADASMWSVSGVLGKSDVPHITYTDVGAHLIKYATQRGGRWEFQTVDSISMQAYPDRNGIVLDAQGNPYISYYDAGVGVLKVAHQVNGRWVVETVDQGFVGYTSSIQIGNGRIWLTYGDESGQQLRFAYRDLNPPASTGRPQSATIQK
jgi:hypothetical protein